MSKTKTEGKFYRRLSFRITAGVLAAAILMSIGANAAVSVKIHKGSEEEAATNYLVENTDYVGKSRVRRMVDKLNTLAAPDTLEDFYRLAGTQIAEEKYDEALVSIDRCLELYAGEDTALHLDLLLKRGCLLVLLEQYDEALDALDSALEQDPSQADAYLIRAQIFAEREEMELLAEALKTYLELKPEDCEIRALLAQAMFTAEDYEGATEQYRLILDTTRPEQEADLAETAYLYGLTCIQLGDFTKAEQSLSDALAQDDTLEGIYYYRGICRMARGDYAGAVTDMTASIAQGGLPQLSHYSRGVCTLMTENYDYEAALTDLRAAANYQGDDADDTVTQQARSFLNELAAAEQAAAEEAQRVAAEEAARIAAEQEDPGEQMLPAKVSPSETGQDAQPADIPEDGQPDETAPDATGESE